MDVYLVVVRLIHIVAAALWVGSGFFATMILTPTLVKLGTEGSGVARTLGQSSAFRMIFPVSGGLTVLAGLLLYFRPGESAIFSSTGWLVLSIGALAGVLGVLHGGAMLARMVRDFVMKLASGSASSAELSDLGANLLQHSRISLALLIIAVVGMSLARYI
jgi:uncharacterized membrane protein